MEFQDVLQLRKSVRHYIPKEVEKEKIREIINAAIMAPSWKNSQATRYYAVMGGKTYEKVRSALPEFNQKNTIDAPVLIVSTIVLNRSGFERNGAPSNELGNGWGYYDCGMHNMVLLLKAAELGLATLVMGIGDADKIRSILDIPENESVVSVISVGYTDVNPERPKRKTVDDILYFYEE